MHACLPASLSLAIPASHEAKKKGFESKKK
jgi:hypothetical protein